MHHIRHENDRDCKVGENAVRFLDQRQQAELGDNSPVSYRFSLLFARTLKHALRISPDAWQQKRAHNLLLVHTPLYLRCILV